MNRKPKYLRQLKKADLFNRRVLLRLDLNVPIYHGQIGETFRLERARMTIKYLAERGARTIIMAHLGETDESLEQVAHYFRYERVKFFPAWPTTTELEYIKPGQTIMLENLRRRAGEKANDPDFTRELASLGELYVNDAFSASHRVHASIVGLPQFLPSVLGLLFEQEVKKLSLILKPIHPFLFILGGVKMATKVPLVKKFLPVADRLFVGGAVASVFFRARRWPIGRSITERVPAVKKFARHRHLLLPLDVVVENNGNHHLRLVRAIEGDDVIYDIGPATVLQLEPLIKRAKLIVWNGPLGYFEKGYSQGTNRVAKLVASSRAKSIVGGGDTVAAISQLGLDKKFTWLSTGGGAMLQFLATGTLPGIEALKKSPRLGRG